MSNEDKLIVEYIAKKCNLYDTKTETRTAFEHSGAWFLDVQRRLPDSAHFKHFNFTPLQAIGEIKIYFDEDNLRQDQALMYFKKLCILAIKELGITSEDLQ